jgi:hypothetical protein
MLTSDVQKIAPLTKQEAFPGIRSEGLRYGGAAVSEVFSFGREVARISFPGGRYTAGETITRVVASAEKTHGG